jgi:hypothetical protein
MNTMCGDVITVAYPVVQLASGTSALTQEMRSKRAGTSLHINALSKARRTFIDLPCLDSNVERFQAGLRLDLVGNAVIVCY